MTTASRLTTRKVIALAPRQKKRGLADLRAARIALRAARATIRLAAARERT